MASAKPPESTSSSLAAFQFLDDQVQVGALTIQQVEDLKSRFVELDNCVQSTRRREKLAADSVDTFQTELRREQNELQLTITSKEKLTEHVEELAKEKDQVLKQLRSVEEEESNAHFEFSELKRTNTELNGQVDAIREANVEKVEPQLESLRTTLSRLREEQNATDNATKQTDKEQSQLKAKIEELLLLSEEATENRASLRQEWIRIRSEPERVEKQATSVHTAITEVNTEVEKLMSEVASLDREIKGQLDKRSEAASLHKQLNTTLDKHRAELEQHSTAVSDLQKSLRHESQEKQDLSERKLLLEKELKDTIASFRQAQTSLTSLEASYERSKKELKRRVDIANSERAQVPSAQNTVIEASHVVKGLLADAEKGAMFKMRLRKEVDVLVHGILVHEAGEGKLAEELQDVLDNEAALEQEKDSWRAEESLAHKQIAALKAQRELRGREAARFHQKLRTSEEEKLMKELQLVDLTKQAKETVNKLREYSRLYEIVKNERNSCVNAIQASSQALAEMKERIKILQNEVEILQNESIAKDKALAKERLAHADASVQRDTLRFESNKAHAIYKEKQRSVEQQIVRIDRLNAVISNLERTMLTLKSKYERAVEDRNHTGIQLIDRNDELCVLYEKANIHDDTLQKGASALAQLDEQLRAMKVRQNDVERELNVARQQFPRMPIVAERLLTLQKQLANAKKLTEQLALELETPAAEGRWQPLEGFDADSDKLAEQVAVLENRLNNKREKLLERELVLEELKTLSETLEKQANEGRAEASNHVSQVHNLQARIQSLTKKMMALVSELSMHQAISLKLEREKDAKVKQLNAAEKAASSGDTPTRAAQDMYNRLVRYNAVTARRRKEQQTIQEEQELPPNAVRTTAEPRPNAYIPDGDAIGLPKPYGNMAPLKPSKPGANMRHVRKPQQREVEL